MAHKSYHILYEKNKAIIEMEYLPAVQLVYEYKRDVIQDPRGATTNPYTSKLHMVVQVMRRSTHRDLEKFYDNLYSRIDCDPAKVGRSDLLRYHQQSRFIIENMAYSEYASVEDLSTVIMATEKVFTTAGVAVTNMINNDVYHTTKGHILWPGAGSQQSLSVPPALNPILLQELAECSKTLAQSHNVSS